MKLFDEFIHEKDKPANELFANRSEERPRFDRIDVQPGATSVTLLGQFFIAPHVLYASNFVTEIPVKLQSAYQTVLEEIAPHFEKITLIQSTKSKTIQLQRLKESSKELFLDLQTSNSLIPIIYDLYGKNIAKLRSSILNGFQFKEYRVNLSQIKKIYTSDVEKIWGFLVDSYFAENGCYIFSIQNWVFDESFKEHITIRALASICTEMRVTVNLDDHKIYYVYVQ